MKGDASDEEPNMKKLLIGKDLPRAFDFSGKQLIVKSTRTDEHWRAAWEHYQAASANHCTPSSGYRPTRQEF
jgi:hypothetical protein